MVETLSSRLRGLRSDTIETKDALVITAVVFHGPVDILTTLSAMGMESNPIVLELGWGPWLAVKGAVIVMFGAAYLVARDHDLAAYAALVTAVIGAVSVLNITVIVSGVAG